MTLDVIRFAAPTKREAMIAHQFSPTGAGEAEFAESRLRCVSSQTITCFCSPNRLGSVSKAFILAFGARGRATRLGGRTTGVEADRQPLVPGT